MSLATVSASQPASAPAAGSKGIPPLPLLTLINYFNYMDRQVVYGMTARSSARRSSCQLAVRMAGPVNLMVFAIASADLGPDRRPDRAAQGDLRRRPGLGAATIGSALSQSFAILLICRALVGVGEGALRSERQRAADARPRRPRSEGARSASTTSAWRSAGPAGSCWATLLASMIGWRGVFWIAGGPSVLLAAASAFMAAPARLRRPTKLPARAYLLSPTYLIALAGGILATFGASGLVFWSRAR